MSWTNDDLGALGLDPSRLGDHVVLPWPEDAVGRGKGPVAPATGLAGLTSQHVFAESRLPIVEQIGARLQVLTENPWIVRVIGPPGAVPSLRSARVAPGAWQVDQDDPATVAIDLRAAGAAAFLMPDGNGLLLSSARDGIQVCRLLGPLLHIDTLTPLQPPLDAWCAGCPDPWLVGEIGRRQAEADPWQSAAAAGLYARFARVLEEEGDATQRRQRLSAELARPRAWARALSLQERATLEDLAMAEVDRLHAAIEDLHDAMECDEDWWLREVAALCTARDDLDGVRVLLYASGVSERIQEALASLDRQGMRFVRSLPVRIALEDEQLRRAASFDPGAWWLLTTSASAGLILDADELEDES